MTQLCILLTMLLAPFANALDMDFTSQTSINSGLALLAKGLMDYYNGNDTGQTPGMFTNPYYWWEAGAAWGSMLDYQYYTGDDTYNDLLKSSMLFQTGADWDFMPMNQTTTEGNDDQGFWGVLAMAAAEKNFSNPSAHEPQWLYLAQAVFNIMASRWDMDNCNGGLRWQIYTWNNGYSYKNSVANGCLFNLAARLARYTGNETYTDWANKIWNWTEGIQLVDTSGSVWPIYDGATIDSNCTTRNKAEWTYNTGLFLSATAFMYNHTNDTVWLNRSENIWGRAKVFFLQQNDSRIMYEAGCQPSGGCNADERTFKGIFSRFLGLTCLMAPSLDPEIQSFLASTTPYVLSSCSGGSDGHTCGLDWSQGKWDGMYGLGEQMCALEALQNRLIWTKPGPLTHDTGASSKGNGSAGGNSGSSSHPSTVFLSPLDITGKDRAGAGVLTAVIIFFMLGTAWWLVI